MPISNLHQGVFAGASGASAFAVDNSAMFNDGDSEDLSRTFGSGGNRKKWTFATWFKTTVTGNRQFIFGGGGSHDGYLELTTDFDLGLYNGPNGDLWHWNTKQKFRDPHAWYHIVWVFDSNNSTANHRMRFYVNGVETDYSDFTITSNGTQNNDGPINEASQVHKIGEHPGAVQNFFDGYLAETVFLDGIVADATSFGEFDSNGVWKPIDVSGLNFGTTGFYLDYETSGSDLGDDKSGNGNDFTNNNSVTQSADSPTLNYAVMTPLHIHSGSFSEGNTTAVTDGTDGAQLIGSMAFDSQDSDGYYFVVRPTTTSSTIGAFSVGVATVAHTHDTPFNDATNALSWFFNCGNGNVQNNSTITNGTWDSQSNGGMSLNQYVQVAVKAGKIYFGVNNTWYDSSDGSFANAGEAFSNLTGMVIPMIQHAHASAGTFEVEFGAFGYTHAKPSGYKDITAANAFLSNNPTIEDGSAYFQTTTYTGTGSAREVDQSENSTFQPDFVWVKERGGANEHRLIDAVRGATKTLYLGGSMGTAAEATESTGVTSFDSDGFSVGTGGGYNNSSDTYVGWQWRAGGASPTKTYTVKVVSDSGNKYRFDDFGTSAVTLDLQEGGTYTFNLNDSSNDTHPFNIGTSANANVYGSGILYYLDGVSVTNSAYISGFTAATTRKIVFTVPASAPTLYYFCSSHSGMGGQINTNSTFGSSNFAGSVQTLVSSNVTSGFSICKLNPGGNSNITFGHELGVAPQWVLVKNLVDGATNWQVLHQDVGSGRKIFLNSSSGSSSDTNMWQNTDPTSSVVSMGTAQTTNENVIAYCWAEIAGFSKFGVYNGKGNGSTTDGPFIETGFSPAWLMIKRSGATENWFIFNNKSDPYNPAGRYILADGTNVENDHSGGNDVDFLANGFRLRANNAGTNTFDNSYIYMTFAENPFAGSTPMTAR